MDIPVETLQAFLDNAWDAAPSQANTLRDQLRAYESSATALYAGGSLAAVAKNSASQTYRGPGLGSLTFVQIGNAWRMLINLFDKTSNWVAWALSNVPAVPPAWWPTPQQDGDNDQNIYNAMKWVLGVDVSCYQSDFTDLRLYPTIFPQGGALTW